MIPEGRLQITITRVGACIAAVGIAPRPLPDATRLLGGRTTAEVVATIPLLYSLCGRAQQAAGAFALAAAGAAPPSGSLHLGVAAEAAAEYLWRLFIDLPGLLGESALPAVVAPIRRAMPDVDAGADAWRDFSALLSCLLREEVFGGDPAMWCESQDGRLWREWLAQGQTAPARWLRSLREACGVWGGREAELFPAMPAEADLAALAEAAVQPGFAVEPQWFGRAPETGALARWRDHPLLVGLRNEEGDGVGSRMAARLLELAELEVLISGGLKDAPARSIMGSMGLGDGAGCAWVETARGLLLHRVDLSGAAVASYRIVAPTEWNFHPQGPLVRWLEGLPAGDEAALRWDVVAAVTALDPCVAYGLEVSGA